MLGIGHFVVGVFHPDAHFFHGKNGFPAQVGAFIQRRGVEIAGLVDDFGALVAGKIEELQFRAGIIRIAFFGRLGQHAFQGIAGVAGIGSAIRRQDIAKHPGHGLVFRPPGQDLKGGGVGLGNHVALFNPGKTLDGRAIKSHALGHGLFQFRRPDGEAFQYP